MLGRARVMRVNGTRVKGGCGHWGVDVPRATPGPRPVHLLPVGANLTPRKPAVRFAPLVFLIADNRGSRQIWVSADLAAVVQ